MSDHLELINSALQSPSAHNAQPWKIHPQDDGKTYEIHYWQTDDLPEDHDNKDAYLTMGAFVETTVLQAPNYGFRATVEPELTRQGYDLYIAKVAIEDGNGEGGDPLSDWIGKRHTNRNKYSKDALPDELETELRQLGNVLLDPRILAPVVREASAVSWSRSRYIDDLKNWFREDNAAEDGITPLPFNISKSDIIALKFAFWHGPFKSKMMGQLFSSKDVGSFTSSAKAAVVGVDELSPQTIFEAGRKMLRSWVTITSHGFAYQPFSVAVDERNTVGKVAAIAGVKHPVALYRVGKASKSPKALSNRKALEKILI